MRKRMARSTQQHALPGIPLSLAVFDYDKWIEPAAAVKKHAPGKQIDQPLPSRLNWVFVELSLASFHPSAKLVRISEQNSAGLVGGTSGNEWSKQAKRH